jgi:hypothetical protein
VVSQSDGSSTMGANPRLIWRNRTHAAGSHIAPDTCDVCDAFSRSHSIKTRAKEFDGRKRHYPAGTTRSVTSGSAENLPNHWEIFTAGRGLGRTDAVQSLIDVTRTIL